MSRHCTDTHYQGQAIRVIAGYDRPLREVFLQVLCTAPAPDAGGGDMLYSSLAEPILDWAAVDTLVAKLDELAIAVPDSFIAEIWFDATFNGCSNRMLQHHFDRPPETLPAT